MSWHQTTKLSGSAWWPERLVAGVCGPSGRSRHPSRLWPCRVTVTSSDGFLRITGCTRRSERRIQLTDIAGAPGADPDARPSWPASSARRRSLHSSSTSTTSASGTATRAAIRTPRSGWPWCSQPCMRHSCRVRTRARRPSVHATCAACSCAPAWRACNRAQSVQSE